MKIIFSSVLLSLLFLTGCNSSSSSSSPPPIPPPTPVSVELQPTGATLDVGTSEKFKALAIDENGVPTDVTDQATWSLTKDDGTVQLDATDASLVQALVMGDDSVTASYGGVTSDPATVTVVDITLVSLAVTPANVTMVVGSTQKFTVEGTYFGGSTQDLTKESTWTSDNPSFVSMNGNIATADKVTINAAGIKASFDSVDSPNASVETFDVIQNLVIAPDVTALFQGQAQQYRAEAFFAGNSGTPDIVTESATWSSSNIEVMAPDKGKGSFVALGVGTATIEASHENSVNGPIIATKIVTVTAVTLDRIEIRPITATITDGQAMKYEVWAINVDNSEYMVEPHPNLTMEVIGTGNTPGSAYIELSVNFNWILEATGAGDVIVTADYLEPGNPGGETHHDHAQLTINPKP